jgi:hypothetical protein
VKRAFAARLHDAGIDEAFEVMTERRGRHVDMRLNRACGRAFRPRLHDEPKNRQAHGVPQCTQLLGVMFQFRGHALLLDHSKYQRKAHASRGRRAPIPSGQIERSFDDGREVGGTATPPIDLAHWVNERYYS